MRSKPCLLGLVLVLAAGAALASSKTAPRNVQGTVTEVLEGDVIVLTPADQPALQVRLRDIDAPELCQPYGEDARKALAELARGKVATLRVTGPQNAGRTTGFLMIDELNVNRYLVENGFAWSVRTRWDQGPLVKQEKMARALTRGLHGTLGAMPPWEFKRKHGKCPPPAAAAAPATKP
jgi:micrococcal nuclease